MGFWSAWESTYSAGAYTTTVLDGAYTCGAVALRTSLLLADTMSSVHTALLPQNEDLRMLDVRHDQPSVSTDSRCQASQEDADV